MAVRYVYHFILSEWCLYFLSKRLIIYCFTSRSRIFGDVIIAGEGLQKLGPCSALRIFGQEGIFIVPHML
jgi:hypothetical protein